MTDEAPIQDQGQVTPEAAVAPAIPEGQATTTGADPVVQQPPFEERLNGLLEKKKWNQDNWQEQIVNAYGELESKLGSYSELQRKALEFDRLNPELTSAREKAQLWDSAQKRLKEIEEQGQLENGSLDLSKAPTDQLARMWQSGKLGLNDVPPERQYEVQQFVNAQNAAIEQGAQRQAQQLAEKHPILKNEEAAAMIADQIEKGVIDPKTGKELEPEEIIVRYERLVQFGEKQAEERYKKDTEMLKNGNLDRPGSGVTTQSNIKSKSVADAFRYAKEQHGN